MHVYLYKNMYSYIRIPPCIYVYIYKSIYIYIYTNIYTYIPQISRFRGASRMSKCWAGKKMVIVCTHIYTYKYMCMCVCIYVRIYVYVCIYVYIHIYTHTLLITPLISRSGGAYGMSKAYRA